MMPASPCDRYAAYFEAISPQTLGQLRDLCTPEVHFKDPFNDFKGVETMIALFEKMYEEVEDPGFRILRSCEDGRDSFIHWEFTGHAKKGGSAFYIEGVSWVLFDAQGLVVSHHDFWDPAHTIYEKVPVLGGILKTIRRRLSLSLDL